MSALSVGLRSVAMLGALEKPLGSLWGDFWETLGNFRGLWEAFGGFGEALGKLWEALGGFGRLSGASGRLLGGFARLCERPFCWITLGGNA